MLDGRMAFWPNRSSTFTTYWEKSMFVDGISQKWEDLPRQVGDGSEWTVCEDWEAATGLVNNILHVTAEGDIHALKDRFKDEPVFKEVLDAMLAIDSKCSVRDRQRA